MNERIKELAEQAGYKHPDAVGICEDYAYFDHKKFAELIVRECAKRVDYWESRQGEHTEDLLKHFGVE
jgi:cupin superfamily acireductone dioxygenase involved in methionine salvage